MVQAWSFGTGGRQSPEPKKTKEIPGPGQYGEPPIIEKRQPAWGMGTGKRYEPGSEHKLKLEVPGPTAYSLPSTIEGPKISMSSRLSNINESKFQKEVPGPGSYSPLTLRKQNLAYSFGLKPQNDFQIKYQANLPGPGQYEVHKINRFSTSGACLSRSDRSQILNKTQKIVPGPGQYDPTSSLFLSKNDAPKYGFGRPGTQMNTLDGSTDSLMKMAHSRDNSPGPGQYDIKGVIGKEGPKKSIAGRVNVDLSIKESKLKPGPGHYVPKLAATMRASPTFKLGTGTREDFYLKDKYKNELPPPNIYDPKIDFTKRKSPAPGFGYGDRDFLNRTTVNAPGPGLYELPSKVGEGPKYGLRIKLQDRYAVKKALELPGPDQYNPNYTVTHKRQGVFSVGRSKRPDIGKDHSKMPGPGEYYNQMVSTSFRESPRFGFGSSDQRPWAKKDGLPGPGYYKVKCTFADVPKYLIPNQSDEYRFV